jgi:2-polyprenyl-3-methyl-5-hydroxy-6-metoxy-1,4-benzoquinol methylase
MLEVPEHLNRNAQNVRDMADPADTGLMLIDYMCRRIGIDSLAGRDVLDFGCGVRFTQSIVNREAPIGSYVGVEVEKTIVDFLKRNVDDPRLSYHHVNTVNRYYNPDGEQLDTDAPSPLGAATFDVICMISVITHQQPDEAARMFRFLRPHIRPGGALFFSAFIHKGDLEYEEIDADRPGRMCSYSLAAMTGLLEGTGWSVRSVADPRPGGIPIRSSFLCTPA